MDKKTHIVWLLLLSGFVLKAQQGDTLHLQDVIISSTRFEQFNTGSKEQQPDSLTSVTYRTQSLAELLSVQSQVFIKSYGQGSLATSSFRGAAADHTAVLWKGFNLQSPMNGQIDLSLLNNDAADHISIQYGGNGALFGTGAVGGIIKLHSSARYNSGLHASAGLQAGSFGHHRNQASVSYGSSRWYTTARWFRFELENDFKFTNTFLPDRPVVRQINAKVDQQGFINEHYIRTGKNQELNVNFWYQYANTHIPPSMSVPQSASFQQDENYRATAEWKLSRRAVAWFVRTAYFDQAINYNDPVNPFFSGRNRAVSSISEAESRIRLHANHYVNIGVNNTYVDAFSNGYGGWFRQNRTSVFASYKVQQLVRNVEATVNIREERVGKIFTPVTPSLGAEWKVSRNVRIFGNISRNYRLPTFNENYWITGVTTDLKPESGWAAELSSAYKGKIRTMGLQLTLTAFSRNMDNWIMWLPVGANWAPQNIKKVWSRGGEAEAGADIPVGSWKLRYHATMNYVLSTNEATSLANDEALGSQLIYVPRITQQHQLTAAFGSFYIGYLHAYTGMRYTSTDNTQWLRAYITGSVVGGKEFSWKRYAVVLTAQVNNVFDATYQAIADRPMPGRHFLTSITLKL
jgi:vitamin B12 transporter